MTIQRARAEGKPEDIPLLPNLTVGLRRFRRDTYRHALLRETQRLFPDAPDRRLYGRLEAVVWNAPARDEGLVGDALRWLAEKWVARPFPPPRWNQLQGEGRDLDLDDEQRQVVLHRAALREGVRWRMRERRSTKPFRNAVTEEATQFTRDDLIASVVEVFLPGEENLPPDRRSQQEIEAFVVAEEEEHLRRRARLTEAEEEVWILAYGEAWTNREIATETGRAPSTVGVLLHRARRKLAKAVEYAG